MSIFSSQGVERINSMPILMRSLSANIGGVLAANDYIANCNNNTSITTGTLVSGTLYAMPFVSPIRGGVLDRIAAEVTTSNASQNFRLGLYENKTDQRDVYPGALLEDSGDISTGTTGIKSYGISRQLVPGRRYWMAIVLSSNTVFRCMAVGNVSHDLGMDTAATTALNMGISVAHSFGALPNPFTGGGAFFTATPIPVLRYRFSS